MELGPTWTKKSSEMHGEENVLRNSNRNCVMYRNKKQFPSENFYEQQRKCKRT